MLSYGDINFMRGKMKENLISFFKKIIDFFKSEKFINFFKSKKFIITVSSIMAAILLCSIVGPYVILAAVRQPATEAHKYSEYFYTTYEEVRDHLADRVAALSESGVNVEYTTYAIDESDDLYIDNIYLPAKQDCTNLIVLTTGVHGMEGLSDRLCLTFSSRKCIPRSIPMIPVF